MAEKPNKSILISTMLGKTKIVNSYFSNYVAVTMQGTELYLDFYTLGPTPGQINELMPTHIARVALPVFQAKGLVSALVNTIFRHQKTVGLLPELREKYPDDVIDTWKTLDEARKADGEQG